MGAVSGMRWRARSALLPLIGVVALSGCTFGGDDGVASLGGESDAFVDGYVNQATADYAKCLDGLGLVVEPEASDSAAELAGYAVIDGATFLAGEDGAVSDDPNQLIGVDGEDRNEEIRSCRAENPGSKDSLMDMRDFVGAPGESVPEGEISAGRAWVDCARDAGFSVIEDPNDFGYVVIPEELTLPQAEELGAQCSAPMSKDKYWPQFEFHAGVEDPETGAIVVDPYAKAIDGPFLDSERSRELNESTSADS